MGDNAFYGWYDDPDQPPEKPTYDPPHDTLCPFCGRAIDPESDVRTHSLMFAGKVYGKRCYFYRTHRTCAQKYEPNTAMDGFILDMIERNGD